MLEITGETKLLAVVGHPIAHSLSPQIHNRFAIELGVPFRYLAFDILPGQLEEFIRAARLLGIAGFNLTMPLKETILPYLDILDENAVQYGAVNTAVLRDGLLTGYNTDGDGIIRSLTHIGFQTTGGKALILGTGGAAKAAAVALLRQGMHVRMVSRRPAELTPIDPQIAYCHWAQLSHHARDCTLLLNATPLGMTGVTENFTDLSFLDALQPSTLVYDLIYAPRRTHLMQAAQTRGLITINGLLDLLYQAALAFVHFTGIMPPATLIDTMAAELDPTAPDRRNL